MRPGHIGMLVVIALVGLAAVFWPASSDNQQTPTESSPSSPSAPGAEELQWEAQRAELHQAVQTFEEAFGTYSYQDTAESRIQRVRPYVTEQFIEAVRPSLTFGSSESDQAFIRNKLMVQTTLQSEDIYGGDFTDENTACVLAVVYTRSLSSSGEASEALAVEVKRIWVKTIAGWQVLRTVGYTELC